MTTAICSRTRKKSRILLAPCSAKLSAQSPPCSRNASPAAPRASAFFRLRASPANTSGGKLASWASTSASARGSGYWGTCSTGLVRQLSGVQRWAIGSTPEQKPSLNRGMGGVVLYTGAALAATWNSKSNRQPLTQALAAQTQFAFASAKG